MIIVPPQPPAVKPGILDSILENSLLIIVPPQPPAVKPGILDSILENSLLIIVPPQPPAVKPGILYRFYPRKQFINNYASATSSC